MRKNQQELVTALVAALVVATGLAIRLRIAWLSVETLTVKVLPDDAFYYLVTAHRVAHGQNVTFDGITPSNGYHPLWLLMLIALNLGNDADLAVHLALTVSALADMMAAALVAAAILVFTGNRIGALFALTFHVFLPENVFASVNGVESAVAELLLAALLLAVALVWRGSLRNWPPTIGILGGLMILARAESGLVFAAALALLVFIRPAGQPLRSAAIAVAIGIAIVLPWLLWSFVEVGTLRPVSAEAGMFWSRWRFAFDHPDATTRDYVMHGLANTKWVVITFMPSLYFPPRWFAALVIAAVAVTSAHLLVRMPRSSRGRLLGPVGIGVALFAAFGIMLFVNSAYRWSVREWYFAWGIPTVSLLAGLLFAHMDDTIAAAWRRRDVRLPLDAGRLAGFACAVAILAFAYAPDARDRWRLGLYPFQSQQMSAARYIEANTPANARIASFNAGVIGYFSHRAIVNVDGVVNPDAYEALNDHRLLAYLKERGVTYVVDYDIEWSRFALGDSTSGSWSDSFWGQDPNASFVPVGQFGTSYFGSQIRLVRLTQ